MRNLNKANSAILKQVSFNVGLSISNGIVSSKNYIIKKVLMSFLDDDTKQSKTKSYER